MTVEKLLKKLGEYAAQGIKRVTDDEGKYIKSVYDPEESKNYVVLNTSCDEDGILTVEELISRLKECLIEPTAVLLKS